MYENDASYQAFPVLSRYSLGTTKTDGLSQLTQNTRDSHRLKDPTTLKATQPWPCIFTDGLSILPAVEFGSQVAFISKQNSTG